MLEQHPDRINWEWFSANPSPEAVRLLAKLNIKAMKEDGKTTFPPLYKAVYDPKRMERIASQHDMDLEDYHETMGFF